MSERVMGSKVEATKGLHGAALNKVMAAAINAKLPKEFRVTLRGRSGGSGITATIKGCKQIWNPERVHIDAERAKGGKTDTRWDSWYWLNKEHPLHAPEAEMLLAFVERELQAYNWDGSDIQTDYFDVRFYLTVEFNRAEAAAQKTAILAEKLTTEIQALERAAVANDDQPSA